MRFKTLNLGLKPWQQKSKEQTLPFRPCKEAQDAGRFRFAGNESTITEFESKLMTMANQAGVDSLNRRALRHPPNIPLIRADVDGKIGRAVINAALRSSDQPFLDFGMAVGKRETAGSVMIRGGQVAPYIALGGIRVVAKNPKPVVDAVAAISRFPPRAPAALFELGRNLR